MHVDPNEVCTVRALWGGITSTAAAAAIRWLSSLFHKRKFCRTQRERHQIKLCWIKLKIIMNWIKALNIIAYFLV